MLRAMRQLKMRRKLTLLSGLFSAGYAAFGAAHVPRVFGAGVSRACRLHQHDATFRRSDPLDRNFVRLLSRLEYRPSARAIRGEA